jgi:hypothetical protein
VLRILTFSLLIPVVAGAQSGQSVAGRVIDDRQQPVVRAQVLLQGTRFIATTGDDGHFGFGLVPPGTYAVRAMRVGFVPGTIDSVRVDSAGAPLVLELALQPIAVPLATVVVSPGTFGLMQTSLTTNQGLTRRQLETVPQLGEDIYRAIVRLPGVSASDFSAKFAVRGASGDELYASLDGLRLTEPFHLKDLGSGLSIIDIDALGGAELITGGASAELGDHTAGVFTMRSRDPTAENARTSVGVSIMNTRFLSQGKFSAAKGGWLVSARRGYIDVALRLTGSSDSLSPRYYDVFGKVQYDLARAGRMAAHVLRAGDKLRFVDDGNDPGIISAYGTNYGWVTWESRWGAARQQTVLSLARMDWSRDGQAFDNSARIALVDDTRHLDREGLRQDWTVELRRRLLVKAGFDVQTERTRFEYFNFKRRFVVDTANQIMEAYDTTRTALRLSGTSVGAWVAQRARLTSRLIAEVGVRYDAASAANDETLSPRVNVAWTPAASTTIRAAWGRYAQSQPLFSVQVEDGERTVAPADVAEHRVAGIEQNITRGFVGRLELYQRRMSPVRPKHVNIGASLEVVPELTWDRLFVAPTEARARGVETVFGRETGRSEWFLSYALAKSEENVGGRFVPRAFDQRHSARGDWSFHPARNHWNFNLAVQWRTGWAFTPPLIVVDTLENTPTAFRVFGTLTPGALNSDRLPAYRRIDVRWTRFFDTRRGTISLFAEVFNLLNTRNVRGYFDNLNVQNRIVRVSREADENLPRIPAVGIAWRF